MRNSHGTQPRFAVVVLAALLKSTSDSRSTQSSGITPVFVVEEECWSAIDI